MESQRLLLPRDLKAEEEEIFEDDWTDRSSYSTYSDSDSDSIIPDWEPYVDDFTGELLYIDCHPFVTHNRYQSKTNKEPEPFSKSQLRRSTRGKFLRLLRRKDSKRLKKSQKPVEEGFEINTQKVKFQDFQEGEQKEVTLEIDHENRYNLSSDKSLAESLLGLIVSTLSDGNRVMIADEYNTFWNGIRLNSFWDYFDSVPQNVRYIWEKIILNSPGASENSGLCLAIVAGLYNVVTQILFLTLVTHVASQLKSLNIYCRNFHLYCEPYDNECYKEKSILASLRIICIKHQSIISFVDRLNDAVSNVLLLEFLLNSLNIAAVMIQISMLPNTPTMMVFCVTFLLVLVTQLFVTAWHANEIEIQTMKAAYSYVTLIFTLAAEE